MIDKLKFSYTEQYKTNIAFAFLLSFIVFQPVLKYFEYVLLFPRINYSVVIIVMFSLYLLAINKDFIKKYPLDLMFPFWILVFVSGIQIISLPWALYYSLEGPIYYFKVLSKTFFCYWMFWFVGLHIKNIISHEKAKLFFTISWFFSVIMIILNSLSNEVFNIILEGKTIYLMLGDTFAVLAIFTLIYNRKIDLFIITLSIIALFALWSRASLYSFVVVSLFYLFKEHKYKLMFLVLIVFLLINQIYIDKDDRMLRMVFGGFDASQSMRLKWYELGFKDLRLIWPFGYFMGDVNSNYGNSGTYMHSYLSFLRQFGIVPFIIFIIALLNFYIKIFFRWFKINKIETNLIFYYTSFVVIEIIVARSFMHPFIWLSLSAIPLILSNEDE